MHIVVINGTEIKGCTYRIKEIFLESLRGMANITEFYLPKDMPHFCCGCKNCFLISTDRCPHVGKMQPLWDALVAADLLVFTSPSYALGISGALKAVLDHLCVRWMVHRPDPSMFSKRAVILTNCVGPSFMAKRAQRDVAQSLSWMGISKIHRLGIGLMEGIIWDELSEKRRESFTRKTRELAKKCKDFRPIRKSLKIRLKFMMCKGIHQAVARKEEVLSTDNQHWLDQGWIRF